MRLRKPADLMGQIEHDLLAENPLDTLLRKLLLLGGNAGSPELRTWASKELRGYERDDDLPSYRTVSAPIQIDGAVPGGLIHHQTISSMNIPDFAREEFDEVVPLRMGVSEIHDMVDKHGKEGPPREAATAGSCTAGGLHEWHAADERPRHRAQLSGTLLRRN